MENTIASKAFVMTDEVVAVGAAAVLAKFIAKSNGIPVEEVTPEFADLRLKKSKAEAVAQAIESHQVNSESRSVAEIKDEIRELISQTDL